MCLRVSDGRVFGGLCSLPRLQNRGGQGAEVFSAENKAREVRGTVGGGERGQVCVWSPRYGRTEGSEAAGPGLGVTSGSVGTTQCAGDRGLFPEAPCGARLSR